MARVKARWTEQVVKEATVDVPVEKVTEENLDEVIDAILKSDDQTVVSEAFGDLITFEVVDEQKPVIALAPPYEPEF